MKALLTTILLSLALLSHAADSPVGIKPQVSSLERSNYLAVVIGYGTNAVFRLLPLTNALQIISGSAATVGGTLLVSGNQTNAMDLRVLDTLFVSNDANIGGNVSAGTIGSDQITSRAHNFFFETRLVPTNSALSNIVASYSTTNIVQLYPTNNLTFTNYIVTASESARKTWIIRPQLIPRGVNWGLGIGYGVRVLTNENNTLWTTLTNDVTYVVSDEAIGTNIFRSITVWQ